MRSVRINRALAGGLMLLASMLVSGTGPHAQTTEQQMQCYQLEQELQQASQGGGSQRAAQLSRIEADMRKFDRIYQQGQAELERRDCYDYFLFSQTVRETPQCQGLARQIENARKRLARLEQQRVAASDETSQRNQQDALIAELARLRCGPQYQQEAKKRNNDGFGFWNDSEGADPGLDPYNQTGPGYATYRTICVRLCDGYYFPISYATVPDAFSRDANACSSQCAAPTELYYYQNPGAEVEQAMSLAGAPYTKLKTAWLYRKELVKGCSCKVAEFADGGGEPDATSSTSTPEETLPTPEPSGEPTGNQTSGAADAPAGNDAIGALIDGEQAPSATQ